MTRDGLITLLNITCNKAKIRVPKLRVLSYPNSRGHAIVGTWSISFPKWAFKYKDAYVIYYLCHELAHLALKEGRHTARFHRKEKQLCALHGVEILRYFMGPYAVPDDVYRKR